MAVALCAAPAIAAEQDFTLHNDTGRTMKALFVSPSDRKTWGADIMGGAIVKNGQSLDVKFDRNEDQCEWDVRAEFDDNTYAEVRDVDFCTVVDVTFNPA